MLHTVRQLFIPEVIQTSAMDCGPASLKALLAGYGIEASYGRLREACQTTVDGTSINTLEDLAMQLGLEAEQVMLPADHVLLEETEALPAIVVVRLPSGLTHFLVVWNRVGGLYQVMDPGSGRRWLTAAQLLNELFIHRFPVDAEAWREWAGSEGFQKPLRRRLHNLGLTPEQSKKLLERANAEPSWRGLAMFDAATRLVTSVVNAQGVLPGAEATKLLTQLFEQHLAKTPNALPLPSAYWSAEAWPPPAPNQPPDNRDDNAPQVLLRGAVLVRVRGRKISVDAQSLNALAAAMPPELAAVLQEPTAAPERAVWDALRQDGVQVLTTLAAAMGLAAFGLTLQALLMQSLLWVGQTLKLVEQRWTVFGGFLVFFVAMALLELPLTATVQRLGRRLETRLRIAFLEKIPRLSDRYFHSRLTSDMTQRAHDLRGLRALPTLGLNFLRTLFQLLLTVAAVAWLAPHSLGLAATATLAFIALAFISRPLVEEQDLRLRSHLGALSRFYLDALLGLTPLRTHSAERAFRREHESLLAEWMRTGFSVANASVLLQGASTLLYTLFAIWILFDFVARGGEVSSVLLLFYWTLNLPVLGQALVQSAQRYPTLRNQVLRLLEPLGAPDEYPPAVTALEKPWATATNGVKIELQNVAVGASGTTILQDINLTVAAGEHMAIVGPSGAGKSSLVGLLLGWHKPAAGACYVDGVPLEGEVLRGLRRVTAWVDPAIQLWNRTLLDNLRYGNTEDAGADTDASASGDIQAALEQADLYEVFARLENGLHTPLGEGGGLVSGGEGQRVRLGRALTRARPRLVILDEPFRGLDREQRRGLLQRAREHWRAATLLCVTHDVGETQAFTRVLVVEEGRIVEDAPPAELAARPDSRYRALLNAEQAVRTGLWQSTTWRRWWIENGKLKTQNSSSKTQDSNSKIQDSKNELQDA